MLSLTYAGKQYLNFEPADLLEAGVPQAAIDAALADLRATAIKAECRRRIYDRASTETQMNMAAAAAVISAKTAANRSAGEIAILSGLTVAIAWVANMRANVAALAADPALDPADDANWPACPQAAIDTAAQF